jgi:hypothetical protein
MFSAVHGFWLVEFLMAGLEQVTNAKKVFCLVYSSLSP